MEDWYLGLDMGTNSVGWAVTDEAYCLLRKKGKDLWGVRLFLEAETAQGRRSNRVSRRRRRRETVRIGYLKELFSEAISQVDAGFYQRLEDSKFFQEDKREHQPFALFADTAYTDRDYFKEYPTIYHLRRELLYSKEPHDVRLVYLAVLNMFKHRGHFLNATLSDGNGGNIKELYGQLQEGFSELYDKEMAAIPDAEELQKLLTDKKYTKSGRAEEVRQYLNIDKKDKAQCEMWKLVCGLQATLPVIFEGEEFSEENLKYKLSFDDGKYEEKAAEVEWMLSEDAFELFLLLKQIHDGVILSDIMESYHYLSEARVASYEKHKEDLKRLKKIYRLYAPEEYDSMFRIMEDNNYSAYAGSFLTGGEKQRRGGKHKTEEFYARLKKKIVTFPETGDSRYVLDEIEKGTFLPKQLTASNGVIPNQVHLAELKKILENAENYLEFLKTKDESGLTVSEKIIQLFSFQMPYYIGPLIQTENNHAWVKRKEMGKVYPWNLEQKIDVKETAEAFIYNLVNHCTYLSDERVLPKNSLLYEKFMVLNELNNLRINGEKISVELKQELYQTLFKNGKKVTGKRIKTYLLNRGYVSKEMPVELTGIDGDCVNRLANYKKFLEIFEVDTLTYAQEQMAEQIIYWSTVYGDSRKFLGDKIEEEYGKVLTPEQKKRILGYKFKDWGRFSREFLFLEGADKETGEIDTIISRLWNENYNLMQLLGDELFTYKEEIEKRVQKIDKTLFEIEYEDLQELYISAPVRRMTWQTILLLRELCSVMGSYPNKVFVEMAREHQEDKKRTVSRKRKFEELYKKCKGEEREWLAEIFGTEESRFRSKKLYLYYTQKGRCMYTGEQIELSNLFNDNLYDIDHIYPRHFVKDDNIDNNLVLVKKESNAHKRDVFPLEPGIREKQNDLWKMLLEGGFITKEKYFRLTRNDPFTPEEQAGFISRQIVETRQGTKAIADLLQKGCPDSDVIYVKAGNVSDFRHEFNLIKCRNVNDFHHAQDAYLNIVVGNVYDTKFTKSPRRFIEAYRKDPEHNKYHMDKLFDFDVKRGNVVAWEVGKSIGEVKKTFRKNSPLVTYMNYEAHGGLADQTLYSAKAAKLAGGEGYIPLKSSDERLKDITKYGGFTGCTGSYFFVVEYTVKGERIRSIENMPLYLKRELNSREKLEQYCTEVLKYAEPEIIYERIKMYSLMKINGYYAYLSGRTKKRLRLVNAVQMVLSYDWMLYIKRINDAIERGYSEEQLVYQGEITREQNLKLYEEFSGKYVRSIYRNKPNNIGKFLAENVEKFKMLSLQQQLSILLEILKAFQRTIGETDMRFLGGAKQAGVSFISKKISGLKECKVIHQSVAGLYVSETDLLIL